MTSTRWFVVSVLALVAAFGFGVLRQLNAFNEQFRFKSFASSSSSPSAPPTVVPLSNDRFVVVKNSSISVYRVDANGRLIRTDDVDTDYKNLTESPYRQVNPTPIPTVIPTPTATP